MIMSYVGAVSETAEMDELEQIFSESGVDVIIVGENLTPGREYETHQVIFSDVHAERAIVQEVGTALPTPFSRSSVGFNRVELVFDTNARIEELRAALSTVVEFLE